MKVQEFSHETFDSEVSKSDLPVLIDFWAIWCGPCRMVAPIIEELGEEYDGKIKVGKVDVDKNQQIAAKYGIRNMNARYKLFRPLRREKSRTSS